jgi:hypothetical protein
MAVTLVVAWSTDLQEPLEVRRSVNMRHAKQIAAELEKEYPWSPRISFYEEVDFLATEEGMKGYTADEIKHARELQETGSTDITEIVIQMLEDNQEKEHLGPDYESIETRLQELHEEELEQDE